MTRMSRRARRFFWWCATADPTLLDAPDTPHLDGIKYAAVGALVCLTTIVAACGWIHNAATMLAGEPSGLALAVGLGLLMGALVFCMERVLVVSIRQDASLAGRLGAIAWRGLIASASAALIATPFALAYFNNGILARLDDERLELMLAKRQAAALVYDLNGRTATVDAIARDLAANRAQRDQMPADVQSLSEAAAACEGERSALLRATQPKIAAARRRYGEALREIDDDPEEAGYLRRRLAALNGQIGRWQKELNDKAEACREASAHFSTAKREYEERLDRQWHDGLARERAAQEHLDHAQHEAEATIHQSDAVVARVTAPDLSARLHALGQMAGRDRLVAAVLMILYGFFFLIDIMPVLAKLVMRTVYDRSVTGEHRRAVADIEAKAALAETEAGTRVELAHAERRGLETLLRETGDESVRELAKSRIAAEIAKIRAATPFAQVDAVIDAYRRTQAQADNIADRYAGRAELFPHIEAVREALAKAMERASASVKD